MLGKLKLLLGITDSSNDVLLEFLLELNENAVLKYCNLDSAPEQVKPIIVLMSADLYRAKQFGNGSKDVSSITEGERTITYANTSDDLIASYESQLKPFKCKKGKLPSDVL